MIAWIELINGTWNGLERPDDYPIRYSLSPFSLSVLDFTDIFHTILVVDFCLYLKGFFHG